MTIPSDLNQRAVPTRSPLLRASSAAVVLTTLVVAGIWANGRSEATERPAHPTQITDAEPAPALGPVNPLGVSRLIRAIPFRLAEPYTHDYRAGQPRVNAGWLVVLGVAVDLVQPTDQFQPVLYAGLPGGAQTLERINQGHLDGVTVALLPGDVDGEASLAGVPIWFGGAELPERLTDGMIQAEAERIEGLSVFTVTEAALRSAEPAKGVIEIANRTKLEETAAELILQYAPGERDLAESFLID